MKQTRQTAGLLMMAGLAWAITGCAGGPAAGLAGTEPGVAVAPADPALAGLSSMAGVWRASVGPSVFEESWSAPAGRNMTGSMRAINTAGAVTLYELMSVEARPDGLVFRLRHFDAALNPWKSEAAGPIELRSEGVRDGVAEFVDADAADGALRRMRYDLTAPGRMAVTLDFGPARPALELVFERAR